VIAARSCELCKEKWFDDDPQNGKWTTKIVGRGGVEFARPKDPKTGQPKTPCEYCPKKSPEEAPKFELSAKNEAAYQLYRRLKATRWTTVTPAMKRDEVFQRNVEIIDALVSAQERMAGIGAAGGLGGLAAFGGLAGGGGATGATAAADGKTATTKIKVTG
jgi:hypothetical protein